MKEIKLDFGNGRVEHIKLEELPIEELKSTKYGTWIMISKPPEYGIDIEAFGQLTSSPNNAKVTLRLPPPNQGTGIECCPIGKTFWREVL